MKLFFSILFFIVICLNITSQNTINVSFYKGNYIECVIGETFCSKNDEIESGIIDLAQEISNNTKISFGLDKTIVNPSILWYNNRTNKTITVDLPLDFGSFSYSIFNTAGKQIETGKLTERINIIKYVYFSTGSYFIEIRARGIRKTIKFIV